jgi:hypothetical protein
MKTTKLKCACAIAAAAGTALSAHAGPTAINWLSPADGDWTVAANWSPANVPNTPSEAAVLGLAGMYTVALNSNITIGGLAITNPDAVLEMNNSNLTIGGSGFVNDGAYVMNINGSNFNANLTFSSPASITGSGQIVMIATTNNDDSQINPAGTLTHGAGHTIRGAGQLNGTILNNGSIIADDKSNIGIRFSGLIDSIGGGSILADGSSIRLSSNSITRNSTFETMNEGVVVADNGTSTIENVTNEGTMHVLTSAFLDLQTAFVNNGAVVLNPDMLVFNAPMRAVTDITIDGSGEVRLIAPSNTDDAQLFPNGAFTLTIGADQTVRGSGQVGSSAEGSITNDGVIRADDPALQLLMRGLHNAGAGVYEADNAVLGLASGAVFNACTFTSVGTGAVTLDNSSATLNSCTNLGNLNIKGGADTLVVNGSLINNGTVTLNSTSEVFNANLRFDSPTTIGGIGEIVLKQVGDFNDAQMTTANGDVVIGSGQLVRGSGRINGNMGALDNRGIIAADDPGFPLVLTGAHTGSMGGTYRADTGKLSLRPGMTLAGGTFVTTGTGIIEMNGGGTATIGNIVSNGSLGIAGQGNVLLLDGPLVNNGAIEVNTTGEVFNARIRAGVDTEISGTGTITLNMVSAANDAVIDTVAMTTLTIGSGQVVSGSGLIESASDGMIVNDGTFLANDPAFPLHLDNTIDATNGDLVADGAVMILRGGANITGGHYSTLNGGVIRTDSGAISVSDVVLDGTLEITGSGSTVSITGDMVNNGVLSLNPEMATFNANFVAQSDLAITGAGSIEMNTASALNDADFNANGFTVTLGEGQIVSGSGRLRGTIDSQGGLAPGGSLRQLQVDVFTLGELAQSSFELGGTNPGEFDTVILDSNDVLTLGGAVTVALDDGYTPFFGDSWDIIAASGDGMIVGEFDLGTTVVPVAPLGLVYRVVYEDQRVFVVLTCDSDLTGDGALDFFDVSLFLNFYAMEDERADFTGDGMFDFFDLSLFLNLFTEECGG